MKLIIFAAPCLAVAAASAQDVDHHANPLPPDAVPHAGDPASDASSVKPGGKLGEDGPADWRTWERATGDWSGARAHLEDVGIAFDASYTADVFHNFRGGLNTSDADQYRGLLGVDVTVDTERVGLWEDGTIFASMFENHGRDITERHVGDLQALNNSDAPNRTRLYEFWYEHSLFDGAVRIKAGKMDANNEFAAPDYGGEFVHSSPGFSPTIPFPTWPDPALGVMVSVEPVDAWYARAAVYDALGTGTRSGSDTAFHRPDDAFVIAEMGLHPRLDLLGQRDLPGTYRVGGHYHSGEWEVLFDDRDGRLPARTHRGNSGVYLVFDQLLRKENPADDEDEQGLGAFFQFGWAPSEYNEITQHYGGGLQFVGLLPGRDDDVLGLGIHHVSLSGRVQSLEQRFSETAIEILYALRLTKFITVKPDLHYIVNPGGAGRDAVVAGARIEMSF